MAKTDTDIQSNDAIERLRKIHPALVEIMDGVKWGELDEPRAVELMGEYLAENPSAKDAIQEAALGLLPLVPETGQEVPEGIMVMGPDRLPRLNPLYEAALIERIQFDGDVPELRTGPMGEGVKAAVPIQTDARDPAILGSMLVTASEQVTKQVETHENARLELVNQIVENPEGSLALMQRAATNLTKHAGQTDVTDLIRGSAETDYPAYKRGQLPAPVSVTAPSGAALARMPSEERKKHAWRFLSTTQGRRSAVHTISALVAAELTKRGFNIQEHDLEGREPRDHFGDVLAEHQWKVNLTGAGETQSSFSLIDVAARVLGARVAKELKPQSAVLEIWPVNTVEDREVGWGARLLPPSVLGH